MIPPQHYSSPMMSPPFDPSLSHSLPPSLPPRCVGTIGPPSHSRRGSIPMPSGGTCFMYGMSVCTCSISVHCTYMYGMGVCTCSRDCTVFGCAVLLCLFVCLTLLASFFHLYKRVWPECIKQRLYMYIIYIVLVYIVRVCTLLVFATSSAAFPRPLQRMSSYSEYTP